MKRRIQRIRLEFHDESANSHKYYMVNPLGDGMCEILWGRIGAKAQSQTVPEGEAEQRIRQKLAKGYEEVVDLDNMPLKAVKQNRPKDPFREAQKSLDRKRAAKEKAYNVWEELAKAK